LVASRKVEFEVTSSWTELLALINYLVNGLESITAEYECTKVGLDITEDISEVLRGTARICYVGCNERPSEGFEISEAVKAGLLRSYVFSYCEPTFRLPDLYSEVAKLFSNAVSYLRPYALRTRLEGIEYMLIVLSDGRAFILEGGRRRVSIPYLKTVISSHTHPHGCIPSPHDVRSLIHVLLDGGFGIGIVSMECALGLLRLGPFTEEDYIALTKFRSALSRRDSNAISEVINSRSIGKSVRVILW